MSKMTVILLFYETGEQPIWSVSTEGNLIEKFTPALRLFAFLWPKSQYSDDLNTLETSCRPILIIMAYIINTLLTNLIFTSYI